jgi:hypothetical protein
MEKLVFMSVLNILKASNAEASSLDFSNPVSYVSTLLSPAYATRGPQVEIGRPRECTASIFSFLRS